MITRETLEYFENHRRQPVSIDLPGREEAEPQITEEQVEELKALSECSVPTEEINSLGRWQAACAIEKLKEERTSLSTRLAFEYMAQKKKGEKRANCLITAGFLLIIFLFFGFPKGLLILLILSVLSLPVILLLIAFEVADKIKKCLDK